MNTCRNAVCGMQIQFGINDRTGKSMPIDMVAVDDGNIVWEPDGITVHVLTAAEKLEDRRPRFTSHFATCVGARAFRKREAGR